MLTRLTLSLKRGRTGQVMLSAYTMGDSLGAVFWHAVQPPTGLHQYQLVPYLHALVSTSLSLPTVVKPNIYIRSTQLQEMIQIYLATIHSPSLHAWFLEQRNRATACTVGGKLALDLHFQQQQYQQTYCLHMHGSAE